MGWKAALVIACCAAPSIASAQDKLRAQLEQQVRRTPESLRFKVHIKGDEMDPSITVDTRGMTALVSKGLLASTTTENSFLRAFIDKKDSSVTAQIYHVAQYGGRGFRLFRRASYQAPDGLREASASVVNTDVSCARYGCSYLEEVVVPIDYAVLQKAAAAYDPANPLNGLHYRLFAQSGDKIDEAIPANEIVAFVESIDAIRRNRMAAGYAPK